MEMREDTKSIGYGILLIKVILNIYERVEYFYDMWETLNEKFLVIGYAI